MFALVRASYPLVLSLILSPPILVSGFGMPGLLSLATLVIGLSLWSFVLELWKGVGLLPSMISCWYIRGFIASELT